MYPVAIEYGIDEERFWDMTIDEISEIIKIRTDKRKEDLKMKVMLADLQAIRTKEYISLLFGAKEVRPIDKLMPQLFDSDYKEPTQEDRFEVMRKKAEVDAFLRNIEKEYKERRNGDGCRTNTEDTVCSGHLTAEQTEPSQTAVLGHAAGD